MRLEFVQQVDGTIITKLVIKSFSPLFKLKSGTAIAVPAVAVPLIALDFIIKRNVEIVTSFRNAFKMSTYTCIGLHAS